jgi:hypothetical protein
MHTSLAVPNTNTTTGVLKKLERTMNMQKQSKAEQNIRFTRHVSPHLNPMKSSYSYVSSISSSPSYTSRLKIARSNRRRLSLPPNYTNQINSASMLRSHQAALTTMPTIQQPIRIVLLLHSVELCVIRPPERSRRARFIHIRLVLRSHPTISTLSSTGNKRIQRT